MLTQSLDTQMREWRHDFHQHPELNFDLKYTSPKVAELLKNLGLETHEGIGHSGVVGILKNGTGKKSIGIRADMDALPVQEKNDLTHKSKN